MGTTTRIARRISITGVVQGVGFRPFVYNLADAMGLSGWVLNHSGGVDIEVEGPEGDVRTFIADLEAKAPPLAHIESLDAEAIPEQGFETFEIRHSESQEGRYQLISPDVATCPDCLRELFDPDDRRYRYPFINCTNCGPRFTIIQDIPYDRPKTTMRVFPMCEDCRAEYEDPRDRRFHAQPNACPVCGPQVWLLEAVSVGEPANERASEQAIGRQSEILSEASNTTETDRACTEPSSSSSTQHRPSNTQHPASNIEDPASGFRHPASGIRYPASDPDAVFTRARELLLDGKILAIKGLGGFHLACDATNAEAVATLRARKHRPHKPFAVMVPTLDDAEALCELPPEAAEVMSSPQCPIVLLERRAGELSDRLHVAENVAPNSHTLGVMIPYTPLHHILLRDINRPLVMTSGNLTEEPIAKDNDEALRRLAPLADAFLLHNRDIHARYDDSVVQVVKWGNAESANERGGEQASKRKGDEDQASTIQHPTSSIQHPASGIRYPVSGFQLPASRIIPVRRARGYAPFPIRLPFEVPQIFAAGPLLKNTFTLTRDTYAFVSQHIGDLENLDTLAHYEAALATYQHLFRIEPELVACDLHPDYMSTRLAQSFAQDHELPAPYRVQHHEAHIASVLADRGWAEDRGPVIGVALDGTGYGKDGNIWGGEWFVGDYRGFERVAHLAYLPLPGGDAAIRHPWRIALAYVHALGLDEALPLGEFCPADVMRVRTMVDRELNTPLTSSMGRLFDAVSALAGVCRSATYEAQAAIELEQAMALRATGTQDDTGTEPGTADAYPFDLTLDRKPYTIGVVPLFEAILDDLAREENTSTISRRFHATVATMIREVCQQLRTDYSLSTVALSGGVFQNRHLMAMTVPQLTGAGFDVLIHEQVPPNDGCISLGQAAMARFAAEPTRQPRQM